LRLQKFKFGLLVLLFGLLLIGCSKESGGEKNDEIKQNKIPSDEELIEVVEVNLDTYESFDIEGHMETIHSESPGYDASKTLMEELKNNNYKFKLDLSNVKVLEKNEKEAKVRFTQKTIKLEGPDFQNNEVSGYHILKPDKGKWKIYDTKAENTVMLDEDGNPLDDAASNEDGDSLYKDLLNRLELVFDDREWSLEYYDEAQGQAIGEFLVNGETVDNWSELYTVHYFEGLFANTTIDDWMTSIEQNLSLETSGEVEFKKVESNKSDGIYEFVISGTGFEDQHELARVFTENNDIFVVRYTIMGEPMEDTVRSEWLDRLKAVNFQ